MFGTKAAPSPELVDALEARIAAAEKLNADLLAMLRDVVRPPQATVSAPVAPAPARAYDRVDETVRLAAGTNSEMRKHLGTWARQQRADGVPDTDICDQLLHWPDDDSGDEAVTIAD